jgi:hypothetical protein
MGNDNKASIELESRVPPIFIGPSNVADSVNVRSVADEVLVTLKKDGKSLHACLPLSEVSLLIQTLIQAMNEAYHTCMLETGGGR